MENKMKKIVALTLILVMALSLCACGFNYSSTSTTTTTTTDADGNTHTETVTTTTENGKTTTTTDTFDPFVDVPLEIINQTGDDIDELYISHSGDESWGENLLEDSIDDGETATGLTISFDYDHRLWDIKTVDEDGTLEFKEVNFALSNSDKIVIALIHNDDDTYTCTILSAKN